MGWKLCTQSSQLHIWGVGVSILLMFLNSENWWKFLYAVEKPRTTSWQMGGSLLWTFVETSKLFINQGY